MPITNHIFTSISNLKHFMESLSPEDLEKLKTALFEQCERDRQERFNKAKEKVIKSLDDFQDVVNTEGGNSGCFFALSSDLFANLAGLKEIVNNWTLEDFKD